MTSSKGTLYVWVGHIVTHSMYQFVKTAYTGIYTLNKISNWSPFKLIISDHALITLKRFFAYICAV